ncbi:3-isopropylmalate dehydrogenase (plasmid) [Buchnera aphidicola (Mindarus keteleerifoliae)]|uniref:3-isopropylmalate dehydrogenase n=1 Tax=Buchnera aphidicola TaxID=9 RepID=UPI0031B68420
MKKKQKIIAVLPGDGIGPEVINETYKIIKVLNNYFNLNIKTKEYHIGGIAIDKFGTGLPEITISGCKKANAILLGSVGGPKWNFLPLNKQPERSGLLKLRKKFNFFCNLRPAKLHIELQNLSPLKKEITLKGFNILCIRELTGGIYFGKPKGIKKNKNEKYAFDTEIYSEFEIKRIANIAFEIAQKKKLKITSIDKANVLESSVLWRRTVEKIAKKFPSVPLKHLYVDNAAMQIIKDPSQFDIILTSNLFGDILSDECAAITGSIGMLPSASFNEKKFGMYEPAGGSAPDIQNKNVANPIAQILSLSMLIEYSLNKPKIAFAINKSINEVLKKGYRTLDISNNKENFVTTKEMGNLITEFLIKEYEKNGKNIISKDI